MESVYSFLETIFPFAWMQYDFMKNAFLAILLITPLFGMIGTMVVDHKLAFFSDALGHSALTGIAIGALLGISNPVISMAVFSLIFALLLNSIRRSNVSSNDTIISVFSSSAIALGLVLLSLNGNFNKYSSYLIGDVLTIAPQELIVLLLVFAAVVMFWFFCFNKLLAISTNVVLAKSRGVRVRLLETVFIAFVALIVTISIKWVGILIINSLLILPAAASRNISRNMRTYPLFAILFSMVSGISGLIVSYYTQTATGPTIVLISAVIFFITFIFKNRVAQH